MTRYRNRSSRLFLSNEWLLVPELEFFRHDFVGLLQVEQFLGLDRELRDEKTGLAGLSSVLDRKRDQLVEQSLVEVEFAVLIGEDVFQETMAVLLLIRPQSAESAKLTWKSGQSSP